MKKIVLAVVAILVVAGFVAYSHLGGAVKSIIESAGSQAMGTKVSVSGLDVSLASETASLSGLTVANPHGFSGDFLKTKTITATLGGIADKTVTITEVVVDGMIVTYELGPNGTNIDAVKRNLKSSVSATSSPKASSAADKAENGAQGGGYDVIIQKLRIVNAQVIPSIGGKSKPVSLPEIVVTNIGTKGNPATPEQVASQIMSHILAVSSGVASAALRSSLSSLSKGAAADKTRGALQGLLGK